MIVVEALKEEDGNGDRAEKTGKAGLRRQFVQRNLSPVSRLCRTLTDQRMSYKKGTHRAQDSGLCWSCTDSTYLSRKKNEERNWRWSAGSSR